MRRKARKAMGEMSVRHWPVKGLRTWTFGACWGVGSAALLVSIWSEACCCLLLVAVAAKLGVSRMPCRNFRFPRALYDIRLISEEYHKETKIRAQGESFAQFTAASSGPLDYIHRDPARYSPYLQTSRVRNYHLPLPGLSRLIRQSSHRNVHLQRYTSLQLCSLPPAKQPTNVIRSR